MPWSCKIDEPHKGLVDPRAVTKAIFFFIPKPRPIRILLPQPRSCHTNCKPRFVSHKSETSVCVTTNRKPQMPRFVSPRIEMPSASVRAPRTEMPRLKLLTSPPKTKAPTLLQDERSHSLGSCPTNRKTSPETSYVNPQNQNAHPFYRMSAPTASVCVITNRKPRFVSPRTEIPHLKLPTASVRVPRTEIPRLKLLTSPKQKRLPFYRMSALLSLGSCLHESEASVRVSTNRNTSPETSYVPPQNKSAHPFTG